MNMNAKGFTLIEVLIGLFIAVIASISVAQVIAGTNKVIDAGRKTFIATNLAHEGLELTRELRDTTWFTDPVRLNWVSKSGLCPDDKATYTYTIDPNKAMDSGVYAGDSNKELYINSSNGLWTPDKGSGPDSGYARVMTIDCTQSKADPAFVMITSTVSWNGAYGPKNVSLTELLYNWLP